MTRDAGGSPSSRAPARETAAEAPAAKRPVEPEAGAAASLEELAEPSREELSAEECETLQLLRGELQDLQLMLRTIRTGETRLPPEGNYLRKTREDVSALLSRLPNDREGFRRIHNAWEKMRDSGVFTGQHFSSHPSDELREMKRVDDYCAQMVRQIGFESIPNRLNVMLEDSRVGYYVPFHTAFEDELPDPRDRVCLLNFLAWNPGWVPLGLVDASRGLVYRCARSMWANLGITIVLLLVVPLLVLIVSLSAGMAAIVVLEGNVSPDTLVDRFMTNFGLLPAILSGAIFHGVVSTAKRGRVRGGLPPLVSLSMIPAWLAARSGVLLWRVILALAAFLGLVVVFPDRLSLTVGVPRGIQPRQLP